MWLKRRLLPKLPRVPFRLVDSDPLIRDAVTFGSHAIRSRMKFILQPWQLFVLILAGWINHREQEVIEYLRAENRILREKLNNQLIQPGNEVTCIRGDVECRERPGGMLRYYYRQQAA